MVGSQPNLEIGWFDRIRNSLQVDTLIQKLNLSRYKFLDIALFVGIGFLVGFLWKKFSNYFIVFILFVAALIILNQIEILWVHVNWVKIQECCGIQPVAHHDVDIMSLSWEWAKSNILILLSFIIGFCFGSKMS